MILKVTVRSFLYLYMIFKALSLSLSVKNRTITKSLVYSNFLIKILILHLQFLKTFYKFPFSLPDELLEIFNLFSFSISSGADKVLNLECFIDIQIINLNYLYALITVFAPLILLVILKFLFSFFTNKHQVLAIKS